MAATYRQVTTWRSAPLEASADDLGTDLKQLQRARDTVADTPVPATWSGIAASIARFRHGALVGRIDGQIAEMRTMRQATLTAAADVAAIEQMVTTVEATAKAQGFSIGDDGSVTDVRTPPDDMSLVERITYPFERAAQGTAIAGQVTDIMAKAAGVEATLENGLPPGANEDRDEYGSVDPAITEKWVTMSEQERMAFIQQLAEEIAEQNGVEAPDIDWDSLQGDTWDDGGITFGYWDDNGNNVNPFDNPEMALNPNVLDDPGQLINTVAHELRHGRQHEAIRDNNDWFHPGGDPFDEHEEDGISEEQAEEWERNFDDYQSTDNGDTFEEYYNQPVEEDARGAGRDYVNELDEDEFDRLVEESR